MQHVSDSHLWPQNFIEALHLLGCAADRLAFGVPDPVLCGPAAVGLYTGGLWSTPALAVRTNAARALAAELFAVGFRFERHLHGSSMCLWHRNLRIGIHISERHEILHAAQFRHVVRVVIDEWIARAPVSEPVSVKVVSIEDLIVEEIVACLTNGGVTNEAATRIRVLFELGHEGVGGEFRADYLDRRLATETGGEIASGWSKGRGVPRCVTGLRFMALSELRQAISIWRLKCGLPVSDFPSRIGREDQPGRYAWLRSHIRDPKMPESTSEGVTNIVPFTFSTTTLREQD
jgi:hypothetical protein